MRTNNVAYYALRLSLGQVAKVNTKTTTESKIFGRTAALLAAIGIGISSFSVKQMLNTSKKAKF